MIVQGLTVKQLIWPNIYYVSVFIFSPDGRDFNVKWCDKMCFDPHDKCLLSSKAQKGITLCSNYTFDK